MRYRMFFVLVVILSTLGTGSVQSEELSMRFPPVTMDQSERALDKAEVATLPCTDQIRRNASNHSGINLDSERVSYSDEFGYIYRYDVATLVPESDGKYVDQSKWIVWTADCRTWRLLEYSMFELQGQD